MVVIILTLQSSDEATSSYRQVLTARGEGGGVSPVGRRFVLGAIIWVHHGCGREDIQH